MPLCWTSGDVCAGFQSQGGSPLFCASLSVCNGFLRFTSDATPADCLATSMVVESFSVHVLAHVQALVWLESGIELTAVLQCMIRQALYRMSNP